MKKTILILFTLLTMHAMAQQANDPVIFEVNGQKIHKTEFMKEFLRSVGKSPDAAPTACTYEKRKALEDYVQLYVNYRAKLADAYALGIDTTESLLRELKGYRAELAAPYLIDSVSMNRLLHEAYERNHYVIHAAHILVHCNERLAAIDTVRAYQRALELLARAQNGEDFYKLAQEEVRREQETSIGITSSMQEKQIVNPYEGDLGCFTVFDMVYPFENKAYALQAGEIGMARTKYGYHIIKVFGRYPYYGRPQIAHIWVAEGANAENQINEAYKAVTTDGKDFGWAAGKYSNDRRSVPNGGVMPEMPCNQIPPEYIEVLSQGMHTGDISKPFHTRFGWHILKLVKEDTIPSFESMEGFYRNRMARGDRANVSRSNFVEQCKSKYHFVDYTQTPVKTKAKGKKGKVKSKVAVPAVYRADLNAVKALLNDSIFMGKFRYDTAALTDTRPLFAIDGHNYTPRDFADYLVAHRKKGSKADYDTYIKQRYAEYVENSLVGYADANLEADHPDFAATVQEYRHGLMIFAYNDQMAWTQAIIDTLGFKAFYDSVSRTRDYNDTNDAIYFWNERADVQVYTITDSNLMPVAKVLKTFSKAQKKGWTNERLTDELSAKAKDGCAVVKEQHLVEKANQQWVAANEWHTGTFLHRNMNPATILPDTIDKQRAYQIVVVERMLPPQLKSIKEARGYYINEYQNELEIRNNRRLREKYHVVIHQDVIDEIAY